MKYKMTHRYSTALSYVVLTGTGIFGCAYYRQSHDDLFRLPCLTYGIIITHSIMGIWRWGNPDHGDKIQDPYDISFFAQSVLALPCITGQLWLNAGYSQLIGYIHLMITVIPLAGYIGGRNKPESVDILMFLNILSCAFISIEEGNNYGVAAAVAYAINQYIISHKDEIFDVPARDFYNYALCFFVIFSYKAAIY